MYSQKFKVDVVIRGERRACPLEWLGIRRYTPGWRGKYRGQLSRNAGEVCGKLSRVADATRKRQRAGSASGGYASLKFSQGGDLESCSLFGAERSTFYLCAIFGRVPPSQKITYAVGVGRVAPSAQAAGSRFPPPRAFKISGSAASAAAAPTATNSSVRVKSSHTNGFTSGSMMTSAC